MEKKTDLRLAFAAAFTTALAVAIVVIARAPAFGGTPRNDNVRIKNGDEEV